MWIWYILWCGLYDVAYLGNPGRVTGVTPFTACNIGIGTFRNVVRTGPTLPILKLSSASKLNIDPVGCMGLIQAKFLTQASKYGGNFYWSCMTPKSSLARAWLWRNVHILPDNRIFEYLWSLQWLLMKFRCYPDTYTGVSKGACNFENGLTLFELNQLR